MRYVHSGQLLSLQGKNSKSGVDIPQPDHQYIPKFCLFSVPAPSFLSASSGTVGFFHLVDPQVGPTSWTHKHSQPVLTGYKFQ